MIVWLKGALEAIAEVIWPRGVQCLCCDELSDGELLCPLCASELRNLRLPDGTGVVRSVYPYRGVARKLVLGLKFGPLKDAACVLSEAMAEEALAMRLPENTILTWVTMPDRRRRARGIDHGRTLCTALGKRLGLPVKQLLIRTRKSRTQRSLSAAQRQANLLGAFACTEKLTAPVLLIDDVTTTGATIRICSRMLLDSGAPQVYALTAARVEKRGDMDEI